MAKQPSRPRRRTKKCETETWFDFFTERWTSSLFPGWGDPNHCEMPRRRFMTLHHPPCSGSSLRTKILQCLQLCFSKVLFVSLFLFHFFPRPAHISNYSDRRKKRRFENRCFFPASEHIHENKWQRQEGRSWCHQTRNCSVCILLASLIFNFNWGLFHVQNSHVNMGGNSHVRIFGESPPKSKKVTK